MAQKVGAHLEDDLNGGPADDAIQFSLDGKIYGPDLSTPDAETTSISDGRGTPLTVKTF